MGAGGRKQADDSQRQRREDGGCAGQNSRYGYIHVPLSMSIAVLRKSMVCADSFSARRGLPNRHRSFWIIIIRGEEGRQQQSDTINRTQQSASHRGSRGSRIRAHSKLRPLLAPASPCALRASLWHPITPSLRLRRFPLSATQPYDTRTLHAVVEDEGRCHPRKRVGEESPDSTGQGVPWKTRERCCQTGADGKCHRNKPPAGRKAGGKGEKVV